MEEARETDEDSEQSKGVTRLY